MTALRDVLVVSDLDGTLLDHRTYSWQAAAPALDVLRDAGAGVVLASSKTAAEMTEIRSDIGFSDWPSIVENGTGLMEPGETHFGKTEVYQKLRDDISDLPTGFRGFGDMSVAEVAERTGLNQNAAQKARQRQYSEPGLWMGDKESEAQFVAAARDRGLKAQRGGRFLTLSYGSTKADRLHEVITRFKPAHTIVLGDAPNDIEMIELADSGVIVSNPASPTLPHLPGESLGHIRRTKAHGPAGWAEAVFDIVHRLQDREDNHANG